MNEEASFRPAPVKPTVSIDTLDQLDIRIGTILEAFAVTGSDKLVQLTVDFTDHRRTILVGMQQERANLSEVEGKQALFVINLVPRRMCGVLSEGMLLDIGYADNLPPALAVPERPVPSGCRAG